jgi:Pyruvate/2-oxoacid:ferredoxin oxidoreductase delta subunit/predicted transcriptional regulator
MTSKDLYHELSESMGFSNPNAIAEILRLQTNSDEVKLLLSASPPATVAELSEQTGIPEADVEQMVESLFVKGMLFKRKKEDSVRFYRARHPLQFHDANILTPGLSEEVIELWRKYDREDWPADQELITSFLGKAPSRIIPVNVTVSIGAEVLPIDDITSVIENAQALAVVQCTCRLVHGECGKPLEVCIQLDKAAEYALERKTGREIDKQEALDILRRCEEEGLVHTTGNSGSGLTLICNCCNDCCVNWPGGVNQDVNFVAPSRYAAFIAPDQCTGCGECMDRCIFEAIAMDEDGSAAHIDEEKCMGCGLCRVVCEFDAITLVKKDLQ